MNKIVYLLLLSVIMFGVAAGGFWAGTVSVSDAFLALGGMSAILVTGLALFIFFALKPFNELTFLKQVVDEMPVNIMVANPKKDFRITFMNKTSLETLRTIQQHLPIPADQILGTSFDRFHKNPAHQRQLLSNPHNLPYRARIKVGPETLDLKASAICSSTGAYLGPMVCWSVVTTQAKMADDFEENVGGIVKSVAAAATELDASAKSLSSVADAASQQATTVASGAEEASTNVSTIAAATEELSSSVMEISNRVVEAAKISQDAVTDAERTNALVAGLAEAATKVGSVVNLINEIAMKTNLLALNATIEAARAGEAGKGFAVVAGEVKTLANQTARATEEITLQVQSMQESTNGAVAAIQNISTTIARMNEISSGIASAVVQQEATTREISQNIQQASLGTQDISRNVVVVTRAVGETGMISGQVLEASSELSQYAEQLRKQADEFLAKVKAL